MAQLMARGEDVISLGQSVPWYGPPPEAGRAVSEELSGWRINVYSSDMGLPELRSALADKLRSFNRVSADPDAQIIITPGSNQAFMMAMLTLVGPGDEVVLPSPYYFNHDMAVTLCGAKAVHVPLAEEDGFQLHLHNIEPYLSPRTKAVVVNSPNNPTGTVYHPHELAEIVRFLAERGIFVVSDEAYEAFCFDGAEHFSPASMPEVARYVITLGSFSKTFGMTGWRVGYLVADAEICRQVLKVQDAMAICASVASQVAALAALRQMSPFVAANLPELDHRRVLVAEKIASTPGLGWKKTDGALFAFVDAGTGNSSWELAHDILDRAHVLLVPGAVFGAHGEGFLRVS